MNRYRAFILSHQYRPIPEEKPPRSGPSSLAKRICAGEEVDRETIWEHLLNFGSERFREVLRTAAARTEVLPPGVIHCLIEADPTWLSDHTVQRQIRVWQMKKMGKALRGIGTALDPTAGKGNRQPLAGVILPVYEDQLKRFKTLKREVRADLKEARRKRLSMDPGIRAAALAQEDKYKALFGDDARELIEAVINRERLDATERIAVVLGQSKEAVRKTIQRERAKRLSRGQIRGKGGFRKKIAPSR